MTSLLRNTSNAIGESNERKDQRKKSKTKAHYLRQMDIINGGNKFVPTPLTIWEGRKDDGRWAIVTQLSRLGSVTPQRPSRGVRATPVEGVVAKNDQGNYFHIEQKFMKRLFDNFVTAKEMAHVNAKGSNAKQLTGDIDGYVLVQWFSNNEEEWISPLLIDPFYSNKKRKSNPPKQFVPGGLSNVRFMSVNYLNERQHSKQYLHACKLLGWGPDTKKEDGSKKGGGDEEKYKNDKMDETKEEKDTKKDKRDKKISPVSSVSLAMDRIPKKDGDSQYTRDLVELSLVYLVISCARRCGSISEEFDRTVGIKVCEGEQNYGKYVDLIESATKVNGVRAGKERKKWEKRKKPCKVVGCSTAAHLTSREGFCRRHENIKRKCPTCNKCDSRRKGGLCDPCYLEAYDPSNSRCKQCDLGRPRQTGGLCLKCLG